MNEPKLTIDILLPVYNGEKFLEEQISSILNQTHTAWNLLIRDDGSTDNSRHLIQRFAEMEPERIHLLPGPTGNMGLLPSMNLLLQNSTAPYIAFSDQDDVWYVDKLERLLSRLRRIEGKAGIETPVLIGSDQIVVDHELNRLADSFFKMEHLDPTRSGLADLLFQNTVTGASSLMNRALLEVARPIVPEARMHDWWFALFAAGLGVLEFELNPTGMYRQHGGNMVGARKGGLDRILNQLKSIEKVRRDVNQTIGQGLAFFDRCPLSSPGFKKTGSSFKGLKAKNLLLRKISFLRGGFRKHRFLDTLALFFLI